MAVKSLFADAAARDRLGLFLALGLVTALAWGYLLYMGWGMEHMDVGVHMVIMPRMTGWTGIDLTLVFLMWAIMMVAMMLPSAMPMILVFAAIVRQRHAQGQARIAYVGAFVAGYVAIWAGFSLIATFAQWRLLEARLMSPMMESTSPMLGGLLLIGAGVFQFTPLKQACLAKCRSPLSFLMTEWRPEVSGALVMGLRHGAYCTGCCWLLMALLFVFGVMNVLWIVALTLLVLIEKTSPHARWLSFATGVVLIAWGVLVLYRVAWPG